MNRCRTLLVALTMATTVGSVSAPALAQDWRDRDRDRYQRDYDHDRYQRDYNRDRDNWRQDRYHRSYDDHRRDKQNEWRNIAIGAGLVGALGFLSHDNTVGFAGTAGALYSAYRMDQDRRSHNDRDRLRAEYFSRPYFYRDGVRYTRHTVHRDGRDYYQFRRD